MPDPMLLAAVQSLPAGAWAAGVSGGADSVALLALLRTRADLKLHAVHLDHQTRGQASTEDARFVSDLAARWKLPCTVARRDQIEQSAAELPSNPSARFRRLRLILFERVVQQHSLQGVILAHHADDQAETVLQRLLRSSGAMGLAGMSPRTMIGGLVVLRPLLGVRREQLRAYLREMNQPWRTDVSNESEAYLRNRLRRILLWRAELFDPLIDLSSRCRELREWVRAAAPRLDRQFAAAVLADLPDLLAREAARVWLAARRVPADAIDPQVSLRLVEMARDAASPPRQHFPGPILVRRRRGIISVDAESMGQSTERVEG